MMVTCAATVPQSMRVTHPEGVHVMHPRGVVYPGGMHECVCPDLLCCRHLVQGAFALANVAVEACGRYNLLHHICGVCVCTLSKTHCCNIICIHVSPLPFTTTATRTRGIRIRYASTLAHLDGKRLDDFLRFLQLKHHERGHLFGKATTAVTECDHRFIFHLYIFIWIKWIFKADE